MQVLLKQNPQPNLKTRWRLLTSLPDATAESLTRSKRQRLQRSCCEIKRRDADTSSTIMATNKKVTEEDEGCAHDVDAGRYWFNSVELLSRMPR